MQTTARGERNPRRHPRVHAREISRRIYTRVPPSTFIAARFRFSGLSNRFRLSKLHRNRCRCPRFPPRRHKPTPVDTDACPGWSPTFSVPGQTTPRPAPARPRFSCRTCFSLFSSLSLSLFLIQFSSFLEFSIRTIYFNRPRTSEKSSTRRVSWFEAKNSLYRKSKKRILGKISLSLPLSRCRFSAARVVLVLSTTASRREARESLRYLGRSLDDLETLEGSPTTRRERFRVDPRRGETERHAGGVSSVAAPFTSLLIIRRSLFSVGLSRRILARPSLLLLLLNTPGL